MRRAGRRWQRERGRADPGDRETQRAHDPGRELGDLPQDFPLPRLLLQPLVENAVRHGVQPLREGGEVVLRGQRDGTGVRIEIINPLPVTPPAAGSVRRRVAYRYGPLATVQAGPQDDRFVVLLQLPGGSA